MRNTARFIVTKDFLHLSTGEVICVRFIPKIKKWYWNTGKNRTHLIPSWRMKEYFKFSEKVSLKICGCGAEVYQFNIEDYTCLPCVWKSKEVGHD